MFQVPEKAIAVTPSNSDDLSKVCDAIYVGTAGDVVVITAGGSTVTLKNLAAGVIHHVRIKRVKSTGTTAVDIVGLYSGTGT